MYPGTRREIHCYVQAKKNSNKSLVEFCYVHTSYLMVYCNIGAGMLWVTWYFFKPVRDKERCKLWGINYSTIILFTSILAFLSIITVFFLLVSMTGKINFPTGRAILLPVEFTRITRITSKFNGDESCYTR